MTAAETLAAFQKQFESHTLLDGGGMVILAERQPIFRLASLRCRAVTEADEDRFPELELGTTQWFIEDSPESIPVWVWEP